eukprot:1156888-Pelagomonas_calceolata.AAC.3
MQMQGGEVREMTQGLQGCFRSWQEQAQGASKVRAVVGGLQMKTKDLRWRFATAGDGRLPELH